MRSRLSRQLMGADNFMALQRPQKGGLTTCHSVRRNPFPGEKLRTDQFLGGVGAVKTGGADTRCPARGRPSDWPSGSSAAVRQKAPERWPADGHPSRPRSRTHPPPPSGTVPGRQLLRSLSPRAGVLSELSRPVSWRGPSSQCQRWHPAPPGRVRHVCCLSEGAPAAARPGDRGDTEPFPRAAVSHGATNGRRAAVAPGRSKGAHRSRPRLGVGAQWPPVRRHGTEWRPSGAAGPGPPALCAGRHAARRCSLAAGPAFVRAAPICRPEHRVGVAENRR